MNSSSHRRKESRVSRRLAVRYGTGDQANLILGYTENISPRGFLLQGRKPVPPGTLLTIALPGGKILRGEVKWLVKAPPALVYAGIMHRMGIRFRASLGPESLPPGSESVPFVPIER